MGAGATLGANEGSGTGVETDGAGTEALFIGAGAVVGATDGSETGAVMGAGAAEGVGACVTAGVGKEASGVGAVKGAGAMVGIVGAGGCCDAATIHFVIKTLILTTYFMRINALLFLQRLS